MLSFEEQQSLLQEAFLEAKHAVSSGGPPIGCVVATGWGDALRIVGRAHASHDRASSASMTADALERAERELRTAPGGWGPGLMLVSTVQPCRRCWNAVLGAKTGLVLYLLPAPLSFAPRESETRGVRAFRIAETPLSRTMRSYMESWVKAHPQERAASFLARALEVASLGDLWPLRPRAQGA